MWGQVEGDHGAEGGNSTTYGEWREREYGISEDGSEGKQQRREGKAGRVDGRDEDLRTEESTEVSGHRRPTLTSSCPRTSVSQPPSMSGTPDRPDPFFGHQPYSLSPAPEVLPDTDPSVHQIGVSSCPLVRRLPNHWWNTDLRHAPLDSYSYHGDSFPLCSGCPV